MEKMEVLSEPIELDDAEILAVSGGQIFGGGTNSNTTNSGNFSGRFFSGENANYSGNF
jgi:hypothetical protein